ncbi:hypothetical protein [Desulfatiferula olefinivorans]
MAWVQAAAGVTTGVRVPSVTGVTANPRVKASATLRLTQRVRLSPESSTSMVKSAGTRPGKAAARASATASMVTVAPTVTDTVWSTVPSLTVRVQISPVSGVPSSKTLPRKSSWSSVSMSPAVV